MADLTPEAEDAEGGDSSPKNDKDLLAEGIERFQLAMEAWDANRKAALEDTRFRNLEQWPEKVREARAKANRPCLVVDKGNQYVRQVVNDGRQNRPGIKIRPVGDDSHEEVAEAFQGLIRSICNRSNADAAYDTALDHAAGAGFGFIRLATEYVHEKTFEQDIVIKRVRNQQSVILDPNIQEADGSDAGWGFCISDVPKGIFKKKWPKAKFADWQADSSKYPTGWQTDETVRVAEYFYKIEEDGTLHQLADGSYSTDEDYQLAVAELGAEKVPAIVDSRTIPMCKVKWCRMSGMDVLEKKDWLGKYIPIIPVFGNELDVDGKVVYSGLIRAAKDAMRLYNYSRSAYAERVALTPKAPYVAAAGQVENHPEWKDANTENYSVLVYDPEDVNGTALPPPQRQQASDIPEGFARDMQLSEHDIQSAMGMFAASIGEKSNEKSGKAIMARQREGDTGTFHYQDNLSRAICYLGRQLVDLIPKIYDSRRAVAMLAEDGKTVTKAIVDPNQSEAVQEIGGETIYNLNVGRYDVAIEAGPSYTTKRMEAADGMLQLVQSAPETMQFAGDIIVRNFDWPGADELAERYKMMLPPPVQEALKNEEQQDPKVAAIVAQTTQMMDQAKQAIAERDEALQKAMQELEAMKADKQAATLKAQADLYNAETERMKVEHEMANPPPVPADTTEIEIARLMKEDEWKKLEAETRVVVAQIGAGAKANSDAVKAETASMMPNGEPMEGAEGAEMEEQPEPTPDTNQVLAAAFAGFQEAIAGMNATMMEMRKPRKVMRDVNGMISGVQ